jgi:hypothetical protein
MYGIITVPKVWWVGKPVAYGFALFTALAAAVNWLHQHNKVVCKHDDVSYQLQNLTWVPWRLLFGSRRSERAPVSLAWKYRWARSWLRAIQPSRRRAHVKFL